MRGNSTSRFLNFAPCPPFLVSFHAKNIWYCRLFFSEIGCSDSIFDYLVNFYWPAIEIAATLSALKSIGANELYVKLHDGICHSRFENPQFWEDDDLGGLDKLTEVIKYSSFNSIDEGVHDLSEELDEIMNIYILENKSEF